MNIAKYTELTGISVPTSKRAKYEAQIRRTKALLEGLLGYTLDKTKVNTNQYKELGKTQRECEGWDEGDTLQDPDDVITAYRLFPYNPDDVFLSTDPFTVLNKVKLVFIKSGEDENGVTIKTFDADELRVQWKNGFAKYIQKGFSEFCVCRCPEGNVQLAVDADWLYDACLPDELLYLWADMVTYEVDIKRDIKSESMGPHSYTKFDRQAPFYLQANQVVLQKYAGPNGSAQRSLTL